MSKELEEGIEAIVMIFIGVPLCIFLTIFALGLFVKVIIWSVKIVSLMF